MVLIDVLLTNHFPNELALAEHAVEHICLRVCPEAVVLLSGRVHSLHVPGEMRFCVKSFPAELALVCEDFFLVLVDEQEMLEDADLGGITLTASIALVWLGTARMMSLNMIPKIGFSWESFATISAQELPFFEMDL